MTQETAAIWGSPEARLADLRAALTTVVELLKDVDADEVPTSWGEEAEHARDVARRALTQDDVHERTAHEVTHA